MLNNSGSILSYDSNEESLKRLDNTLERLHIKNTESDLINKNPTPKYTDLEISGI